MLRIIHKATEPDAPKQRSQSRREKALAWMQAQQEIDKQKALEKFAGRIKALKKKQKKNKHHI